METLRLGTRGSELALFQARAVASLLRERCGAASEIVVIRTAGDRLQEAPLSEAGGKRLFVKEIEDALLSGEVDLAVHSSKDLPVALPDGLAIGAVLPREDPRDAVVLPGGAGSVALADLPGRLGASARIGTSSVRRIAQLRRLVPEATFLAVRGNLDTRLRKLDAGGQFDAIVLAAAGLNRLERTARVSTLLPPDVCIPAPGQGIIAVEMRIADIRLRPVLDQLDDAAAAAALAAERAVVTRLGGGCQMPLGAHAAIDGALLTLSAVVLSLDGRRTVRARRAGPAADPSDVGRAVADDLLSQGAADILAEARGADDGATVEAP